MQEQKQQNLRLKNQQKLEYKSLCRHWSRILGKFTFPALKQNYTWISLQKGEVIRQHIPKEMIKQQIQSNKRKDLQQLKATNLSKNQNLFINRHTLLIYCITCKKEIFDIYSKYSSAKDMQLMQQKCENPCELRGFFIKPVESYGMFSSNLQYPKSFQKQRKNCAILISNNKNSFLEVVLRFIAFIPTISAIAVKMDVNKIKSKTFRQVIALFKQMNSGQYRALAIDQLQNIFFSQYPQFLSYETRKPIQVIFTLFKLIQKQLSWKDQYCYAGQMIETQKMQWDIFKNHYRYSPLKQILLSKSTTIHICCQCQQQKVVENHNFECLRLLAQSPLNSFNSSFTKKKSVQINIIKAIEDSFQMNLPFTQEKTLCLKCDQMVEHLRQTIIQPGNYMLFQLQSTDTSKLLIPKQFYLNKLDPKKCVVNQDNSVFQFIAGIYRQTDDKQSFSQEYGIVVYHIQNKKYSYFHQKNIIQTDNLNHQKRFTTLIYKRIKNQKIYPIIKNIKSTLYLCQEDELYLDKPIPLPDFFDVYLSEHNKIPSLLNPFVCHHGRKNIRIQEITKTEKINYIPVQIYNFLVDQFGGRKIKQTENTNLQEECQICSKGVQSFNQIKLIEKQVMKYVDNFTCKKGKILLVYKNWLDIWKSYLYERAKQNYSVWGNQPPLKINNFLGMKQKNPKKIDHSKYSKVSAQVWLALMSFHRGGPQVSLKKMPPSNLVKNYINLRLQEVKLLYKELSKCLSVQMRKFYDEIQQRNLQEAIKQEQQDDFCNSDDQKSQSESKNQTFAQKYKQKSQSREKPTSKRKSWSMTRSTSQKNLRK